MCGVLRTGGAITFSFQGEGELYGNAVQLRPAYLPTSANRSWIDIDNRLPSGSIERFYIYVRNLTFLDAQSRRIRLQVWRPSDIGLRKFRLIWLQLIEIAARDNISALYSVCYVAVSFHVKHSATSDVNTKNC